MLKKIMIKILLISLALLFTSCANKRGISSTYYNDCKEYYDLQGYYHKDCGENIIDYKEAYEGAYKKVKDTTGKIIDTYTGKKGKKVLPPKPNVW